MSRFARLAASVVLATGLAATIPAGSAAAAGWQFQGTYPTKGECFSTGEAGKGQKWDEYRCTAHIGPLTANSGNGWDLWVVVWVD